MKKNGPEFDAYTMPRMAQYLGRWIRHSGWYPDRKVRLFDRRKAKWVGDFVHESVKVEGNVGHLEIEYSPLHLQLAVGAFEDHGSLHHARGRATAGDRRSESPGGGWYSSRRGHFSVPTVLKLDFWMAWKAWRSPIWRRCIIS